MTNPTSGNEGEGVFDLLTKAIGDISAALIFAQKQDLISEWVAPYVSAINDHDAHTLTSAPVPHDLLAGVTETGWLIEFPWTAVLGVLQYAALAGEQWPIVKSIKRDGPMQIEKYLTPIEMVEDSNKAIRFARKEDAEAFIRLFNSFLLHPAVSEHQWDDGVISAAPDLAAENARLREAFGALLDHYLQLANSGDCGFWNPENEAEVIDARAALARAKAASK